MAELRDPYAHSKKLFRVDTARHQMTVLRDDGLYRHLRFGNERGVGEYWFELVTWPGALTISGDMGGYTFRRVEDMFTFFRGSRHYSGINPGYWSEKLDGGRVVAKEYDEDHFARLVAEDLKEAEEDFPGVTAAWEKKVTGFVPDYYIGTEHEARQALEEFEFATVFKVSCTCGASDQLDDKSSADVWRFVTHGGKDHKATVRREGFWFTDTFEWDLTDWSYSFLWCCHAIVWGIDQYDRQFATAVSPDGA